MSARARISLRALLAAAVVLTAAAAPAPAEPPAEAGRSAARPAGSGGAARNGDGIRLLAEGRTEQAVRVLEEAHELLPAEDIVTRNLAAALAALAEERRREAVLDEAARLIERAIDLHPDRIHYRFACARIYLARGRDTDRYYARLNLVRVLEGDPDHRDALVLLGSIAYQERDLTAAVAYWRHAVALDPDDLATRKRLAEAERELAVEAGYEELRDASFQVRFGASVKRDQADRVLTLCRAANQELTAWLDFHPESVTVVTLYSPGEFRSVTRLHAWVAGLSDGTIRLAVTANTSDESLRATIFHEYTHHLVRAIAPRAPGWLHEGLAQLAEKRDPAAAEKRLRHGPSPRIAEIVGNVLAQADPRVVSRFYDLAIGFTAYLQTVGGDRGIPSLLRGLGEGQDEEPLMRALFGASRDELFERWSARVGTG